MIVLPPWQFTDYTNNHLATIPASSLWGTSCSSSGVANTDGAVSPAIGALTHDVHLVMIQLHAFGNGTVAGGDLTNYLFDIMIDPAGGTSWANFIDDLCCGGTNYNATTLFRTPTLWYTFPVYIKAGTSIGFRCRTNFASVVNPRCLMHLYGNPSRPDMWWCGTGVESLGIDAANSKGMDVTGGASGTFGSWTNIGTSTANYGYVQLGINASDGNQVARGYHWQIGYGSTQLPGSPTFYVSSETNECAQKYACGFPIWCDVPSGTTWQARYTSSGTAVDVYNCGIYGVY